jgi:hypothetical protein
MNRQIFLLIVSLLFISPIFAQSDSTSLPGDDTVKYNFIVIGSRYQNQFAFWGRNYDQKIPFLGTSLMYYFHSGVWVSVSNFSFFDENVPTQLGLTLGYFKELSPKMDWHTSYTQFYVPSQSIPSNYKTQGYAQTTFGIDWGLLFSSIQLHALFNQNSDIFLTTYHSRYFQFNQLLWNKIMVSFEPKVSVTFGTHHFEYASGLVIAPGGGGIVTQPNMNEDLGNKFQALNFDFSFPLKFSIGFFSVEPSWKYTLPIHTNPVNSSKGLHLFAIELNYSVPIR